MRFQVVNVLGFFFDYLRLVDGFFGFPFSFSLFVLTITLTEAFLVLLKLLSIVEPVFQMIGLGRGSEHFGILAVGALRGKALKNALVFIASISFANFDLEIFAKEGYK